MQRTIHKFKIEPNQVARLRKGAKVLSVGAQGDDLFIWAEVDLDQKEFIDYPVRVFGTGFSMEDHFSGKFLGTVFQGSLVWHIFRAD